MKKKVLSLIKSHEFVLGILISIYIAYFTTASFLRYDNFYTGRFDLGNMDQTVWNTINGRIFQGSNDSGSIISRLSGHADFMLILLAPLYLIWPHAKMLLLVQSVTLGFGSLFVFLIAKEVLKDKNFALIFSFLFLMYPPMQFSNLYDFHAVTLATTLLLASFYFLLKRKYFLLTMSLILSGLTKEHVWITTAIFGIFIFFKNKKARLIGILTIIISLIIFFYLVWFAIPQNAGAQHFALAYYSDFGNSPTQVVINVLFSPQKILSIVFEGGQLNYLKQIFAPIGFISLLSPILLVFIIPDLLINLLSNNSQLHQIYYQYTSTTTPFLFIAGIFGLKKFIKWFPKIPKLYVSGYLVFFTLISCYFFGPLPGSRNPNVDMFIKPLEQKQIIESFLLRIPEKYTVAATNNLGSHLSHRQQVSTLPVGIDKADVVLFLLNDKFAQPSLAAQKEMVNNLKHNRNYVKVFEKDDFVVFKKRGYLL